MSSSLSPPLSPRSLINSMGRPQLTYKFNSNRVLTSSETKSISPTKIIASRKITPKPKSTSIGFFSPQINNNKSDNVYKCGDNNNNVSSSSSNNRTSAPPPVIVSLPLETQADFRVKMLTLLCLENFSTFCIFLVFYFLRLPSLLFATFNIQVISFLVSMILSLLCLYILYRDRISYPRNYILLFVFSVLKGVTFGTFANLSVLIFLSTLFIFTILLRILSLFVYQGQKFINFTYMGCISWVLYIITISFLYYFKVVAVDILFQNVLIISLVFMWYIYDLHQMMYNISVDEYLQCVILLYSDIFALVLFIVVMGLLCVISADAPGLSTGSEMGHEENIVIPAALIVGAESARSNNNQKNRPSAPSTISIDQ